MTFAQRLDPEPRLSRFDNWLRPFVSSIRRTVTSSFVVMVVATAAATLAARSFELDPLVFAMLRARAHWLAWYAWYDREEERRELTFGLRRTP